MRDIILQYWNVLVSGPHSLAYHLLTVAFVSLYSFFLGFFLHFFAKHFYALFFLQTVEYISIVRLSGLFLMLSALFYLFPLIDLRLKSKIIPMKA
jgi:hypothetical protein